MAIKGQVRVKCDAKVPDGSYRYLTLTKERNSDVTGELERSCLAPNRTNLVLSGLIKRWLAQHHSCNMFEIPSAATWSRGESMSFKKASDTETGRKNERMFRL